MRQLQPTYLERCLEASGQSRVEFAAWVYRCRNLSAAERKPKQWQLTYPHQPIGFYVGLRGQNGSRWIPHPQEVRPCCQVIAENLNLQYPWVYHRHCRTLRHISLLLNVDESDLRKMVLAPRKRCGCGKFLKMEDYACTVCRG